ncbi:MAG TPA: hypothetical protein VGL24_10350 [Chthoniobacterales bacterium]
MISRIHGWRVKAASGLVLLGLVVAGKSEAAEAPPSLGLRVNSSGVLTKNGAPYRGVGVNYYDAFIRTLRNPADTSYRAGFSQLGAKNIPFARFAAGGWTAKDLRLYQTDKEAYFRLLDGVVQSAEKSNVGLIATLFWSITAVSDAVGEPRERWGDAKSKTRQFMRSYTRDVVSRYANSPAIWGWEFGCELSLPVDLPNPPQRSGKFAQRALSFATFNSAALDFAQVVRGIDSHRILLTGNSIPRAAAYHNTAGDGMKPDTQKQFASILLRDNPGPFNPICIHAAPASTVRYFGDRRVTYAELLNACVGIARSAGKALYLEEFVPVPGTPDGFLGMSQREYFSSELAAIQSSGVPLASVWIYDRKLTPDRSNLTFDNERSYMLEMIGTLNRTLSGRN